MNLLKKAAVSLAATSLVLAPVAASAQTTVNADAFSAIDGQSEIEGASGWVIGLIAVVVIVGGILIASDNDDDSPTSP